MSEFLDTAIKAAKAAGEIIKTNYAQDKTMSRKDDNSPVTITDSAAEQAILDIVSKDFPEHSYFSEEAGHSEHQSEYQWIIDPLDGTTNFGKNLHFFCTSIALQKNNQPVCGVIYIPMLNEMFTAEVGEGAHLNEQPISVSSNEDQSIAVYGFGSRGGHASNIPLYEKILPNIGTYRVFGSFAIALCYVAAGRLDALVSTNCQAHDGAAGTIIASEAGATVTNLNNEPWQPSAGEADDLLVATPSIHQRSLELLNQT